MQTDDRSLFLLFEMTPDLVCIASKEGYFKKINAAVSHTLRYTEEELMAHPISTFIHPDDREYTAGQRAGLLKNQPLLNFQNRYVTKDGETVWLEWTSVYLPENEIVFAIAKVITPRKLQELEVYRNFHTYQQLAAHFKNYDEKSRQQMAGELHEDLAQLATAIKMKLEWVRLQSSSLPAPVNKTLAQTVDATRLLIDKLRNISYKMSPANLLHVGINTALLALCTEFSTFSGIRCRFKKHFRELGLSEEEKLDIYRICEEALQNVRRHAGASEVEVSIHRSGKGLHLHITDNGHGFDPSAVHHSGLTTMKGRALSMHGQLHIKSGARGTTIGLFVPSPPATPFPGIKKIFPEP